MAKAVTKVTKRMERTIKRYYKRKKEKGWTRVECFEGILKQFNVQMVEEPENGD